MCNMKFSSNLWGFYVYLFIFLSCFPFSGESRPPINQSISDDEKEVKEHQVFNSAMQKLEDTYWRNVKHDGQPINVSHVPSGDEELVYMDFRKIHSIVSNGKSMAELQRHPEIYEEYQYTMSHVDRRIGMSIYLNCDNPTCDPCAMRTPIRNLDGVAIIKDFPGIQVILQNYLHKFHIFSLKFCNFLEKKKGLGEVLFVIKPG